jgi:hypothetical protein
MSSETDTIEVDKATADALRQRAAERGVSVAAFLAEVARERAPREASADEIAELDRRWARIAAGEATVAHEDVVRWLETWGSAEMAPRPGS